MVFAILLLACALVPYLSPNQFWPMTFLGLGFLGLLFVNALFFVYYLLGLKKWLIISAIAMAVNYPNMQAYFGNINPSVISEQADVKVATLNTQLFGYFDASKKKRPDWEKEVVRTIKKQDPDILCFQEFLSLGRFDLEYFKRKLKYPHAYFKVLKDGRKEGVFGMVVFSKFPILKAGGIEFSQYTGNMGAWIDVKINDQDYRVMNVHLQSIRFSRADYRIIENPTDELKIEQSKTIMKRIKNAAGIRASQIDVLMKQIKGSPHPMILCGDFNEPPVSYGYGQVSKELKDAYTQTTFGLETTYTGKFPAYRIDYIFSDPGITTLAYNSQIVPSDHKLVLAKLLLPK